MRGRCRDHPRVCGEQSISHASASNFAGSSPRVRGTGHFQCSRQTLTGIIPACAGNSTPRTRCARFRSDHPRVCGEQRMNSSNTRRCMGSSPRVRGTELNKKPSAQRHGIIPACAGNRTHYCSVPFVSWDHPRVCGEQLRLSPVHARLWGSSPRVRGTVKHLANGHDLFGIIPACAGNRGTAILVLGKSGDHPRVCGEQT